MHGMTHVYRVIGVNNVDAHGILVYVKVGTDLGRYVIAREVQPTWTRCNSFFITYLYHRRHCKFKLFQTTIPFKPPTPPNHTMAPRTLMALRPISAFSPIARRTFSTTRHMQIKEDGNRSAQELEQKKQEQLREQKEGKGRWREDLASSGESNIAADKEKVEDHKSHMQELQEQTKQKGEKGEL
jgi:hypothetical protein